MILRYVSQIIYTITAGIVVLSYYFLSLQYDSTLLVIRLAQAYAFSALIFLYFALLASPLYAVFPFAPFRATYIKARKSIGLSAWFFAMLHGILTFWYQLGGLEGLNYLAPGYLQAVIYSFSAFSILTILAITSNQSIHALLGSLWKKIHRLVYIASLLILIHAFMIGTHYRNFEETIPKITIYAITFLLLLEAVRFDQFLYSKIRFPRNFITAGMSIIIISSAAYFLIYPNETTFSIHNIHQKNINKLHSDINDNFNSAYSIQEVSELKPQPSIPYTITHRITDNTTGKLLQFDSSEDSLGAVLFIVDETFETFIAHSPRQLNQELQSTINYPLEGEYLHYLFFNPQGKDPQQYVYSKQIGSINSRHQTHTFLPDQELIKSQGNYQFNLLFKTPLKNSDLTSGEQSIAFQTKFIPTGQFLNLQEIIENGGARIFLINTDDLNGYYSFTKTKVSQGMSEITVIPFEPFNSGRDFTPGVYKLFIQFRHNEEMVLTSYIVKIE